MNHFPLMATTMRGEQEARGRLRLLTVRGTDRKDSHASLEPAVPLLRPEHLLETLFNPFLHMTRVEVHCDSSEPFSHQLMRSCILWVEPQQLLKAVVS